MNFSLISINLIIYLLLNATHSIASDTAFTKEQKKNIEQTIEDFLLKKPEVIEAAINKLQEKRQQEQTAKNKKIITSNKNAIFSNTNDPYIGNPQGKYKLVVFMDPFCGHCRKFHQILNSISQDPELKELKVIFKEIPIFGDISRLAVRAILAAKKQSKYVQFQSAMYEASPDINEEDILKVAQKLDLNLDKFKSDLTAKDIQTKINDNEALAQTLGIDATPTIVYADYIIPGGPDLDNLKKLILTSDKAKKL